MLSNKNPLWPTLKLYLCGQILFSLFFFSRQDESSSSDDDDDEDDEGWGSDTVSSQSESSDEGEGKSANLALVFLKKLVFSWPYF